MAADEALVTRATEALDAVPADGSPDGAADADHPVMRGVLAADTTSRALAESLHELDQGIADLTDAVVARRPDRDAQLGRHRVRVAGSAPAVRRHPLTGSPPLR